MTKLSAWRSFLKIFHLERIPWPGSVIYNAISGTNIFERHYELVAQDIVGYCAEGSILDVGTGPGRLLCILHKHAPGLQIIGLDISHSMVKMAQKNLLNAGLSDVIEVKEGNSSSIPFGDNSFDSIVSTGSIHHWKDPVAGLNDIYRVLKSGGYAHVYDLVSDTPSSVLKEITSEFGRFRMILLWLHAFEEPFLSYEHFESLARNTQFKESKSRFVGALFCLTMRKGIEES